MIFNDYVDYYNEINQVLEGLKGYISSLQDIKKMYINWTINTVTKMYSNGVTSGNISNYNRSAKDLVSNMNGQIRKLDPFVYGTVMNLRNLHQVNEEYNIDLEALIQSFESNISYLHEFSNAQYSNNDINNALEKLLGILDDLIGKFDDIKSKNQMLNKISSNTICQQYYDDAQILTLRFYNAVNSLENYCFILNKIEDSYNRICAIADISTQQSSIIPVKIESGSLFAKLAGNPFVIETIKIVMVITFEYIVKSTITFIQDKTHDRKTSKPEDFNNIKEAINIIGLMREHEISTVQSEEYIEETMNIVCKNIYEITLINSKIKLDDDMLEFSNEVQLALSNNVKSLSSLDDTQEDNLNGNQDQ